MSALPIRFPGNLDTLCGGIQVKRDFGPPFALAVIVLTVLSGCGSPVPDWCAGGNAEVVLDARPTRWPAPPALERLWTIDGSAEGQELVLPASIALSRELHRIAVVDFQLGEVVVASLDGHWLGRWGRRGPGPGEIGRAVAARWTEAATLEVYDPTASKLVHFDTAGAVVGESRVDASFTASLGGGVSWISFTSDGSLVTQPVGTARVSEGMMNVLVLRTHVAGSSTDTLVMALVPALEPEGWLPFPAPNWPVPHAAVSGSGHVAVAGVGQEYRVVVQRPDSSDLVLCRSVDPLPAADDDGGEHRAPEIRAALLQAPTPRRPASVGRVTYDDMDRLWVQRDRPGILRPEDTILGREGALFDVYDGGSYLGEVRLPDRVRFVGALRDLVIGLERNDLDEYSIVAYRLSD
jgi:hypothetical protein